MRILIVSPMFPPQPGAGALRVGAFASLIAQAGEEVTVLTTAKRFAGMAEQPGRNPAVIEVHYRVPGILERLRDRQHAASNGESPVGLIHRLRLRSGAFCAVRMPDLTGWWIDPALQWAQAHAARHGPWDAVLSSCGPYSAHVLALRIRQRQLARKWIADYRDLWTDNHLYRGLFPFTIIERRLERQCLAAADLITTVSRGLADTLRLRLRIRAPVEVIYNGCDATDDHRGAIPPDDGVKRLVYTGTLYSAGQDPSPLLRALASLHMNRPQLAQTLRLTIAGRGAAAWRVLAQQCNVPPGMIEFKDVLPRGQALDLQRQAAALIILDWNDPASGRGVLTAKLFEYLAASAPIWLIGGGGDSELCQFIQRSGRGDCLGRDQAAIERALADLAAHPGRPAQPGNRDFIAQFTRTSQSSRLLELIRRLAGAQAEIAEKRLQSPHL